MVEPTMERDGMVFFQIQGNVLLQEVMLAQFMAAIAAFEGFWKEGSIAQENNNPGNIRPVGAKTGFQKPLTVEEGWKLLRKQVLINVSRGLTLDEFFLGKEDVYPGYTPLGDPGNTPEILENYISFVSEATRIPRGYDLRLYFPNLTKNAIESSVLWGFRG